MLAALDPRVASLDEFVSQVLPADILSQRELSLTPPRAGQDQDRDPIHGGLGETDMLKLLRTYREQIQATNSHQFFTIIQSPFCIERRCAQETDPYQAKPQFCAGDGGACAVFQALPLSTGSLLIPLTISPLLTPTGCESTVDKRDWF
jgi:hypothetical protein